MRKLIAITIAAVFAAGAVAPAVWAQGTATKPETKAPAAAKTTEKKVEKKAPKVDINAASDADLKALGFSDDEAKKIVDGRPWKRKDDLVKKNVITKEAYAKVKDGIVAHKPKAEAKKK